MKISKIINEEIQRLLKEEREETESEMLNRIFTFKQQFAHGGRWEYVSSQARPQKPDFDNVESFTTDFDADITESDIIVTWGIRFQINQNGIENFIPEVKDIQGTYTLEFRNRQSDAVEQESEKQINEIPWRFVVQNNTGLEAGGSFYINDITFDFKNNVCTVTF